MKPRSEDDERFIRSWKKKYDREAPDAAARAASFSRFADSYLELQQLLHEAAVRLPTGLTALQCATDRQIARTALLRAAGRDAQSLQVPTTARPEACPLHSTLQVARSSFGKEIKTWHTYCVTAPHLFIFTLTSCIHTFFPCCFLPRANTAPCFRRDPASQVESCMASFTAV